MGRKGKPSEGSSSSTKLMSASAVRRALDISERAMTRMLTDIPGVKRDSGGRRPQVPIGALLKHLGARLREKMEPRDDESSREMVKYRRARARAAERANQLAEGKLMEVAEAYRVMAEIASAIRLQLEGLERVHGQEVGDAIRDMLARAERTWEERLTA